MIAAFLFFMQRSWRNRVAQFLQRIKSPRYALALIFGLIYFFFAFGGAALFDPDVRATHSTGMMRAAREIGPLVLVALTAFWWIAGLAQHALALTPAEGAMLVPAPLTRRQLVQYKLLVAQPPLLITTLLLSFMSRGSVLPFGLRLVSVWVMLFTFQLHQVGAALVHAGVQQQGRAAWRRVWPATLLISACILAIGWSVAGAIRAAKAAPTGEAAIGSFTSILATEPANTALAPFRAVMAPVTAPTVAAWGVPFLIACAILLLHYVWVIRMDAAFEEGAVEAGMKRAHRLEAMRKGKRITLSDQAPKKLRASWFPISPDGPPVYAIWWKNMLQVRRVVSPVMLGLLALLPVLLGGIEYADSQSIEKACTLAGVMMLMFAGVATFFGPLNARNDMRTDLGRMELMRTLPVGGAPYVGTQIAASTFTVTVVQLTLAAVGAVLLLFAGELVMTPILALAVVPIVLFAAGLNTAMITIHNGIALLFPAWSKTGTAQPGGVEFLGQHMLTMLGSILLLVLLMVPPLLVAGAAGASMVAQWGRYAFIPGGTAFIAALYGELALIITWLGNMYDRLDAVDAGLVK